MNGCRGEAVTIEKYRVAARNPRGADRAGMTVKVGPPAKDSVVVGESVGPGVQALPSLEGPKPATGPGIQNARLAAYEKKPNPIAAEWRKSGRQAGNDPGSEGASLRRQGRSL